MYDQIQKQEGGDSSSNFQGKVVNVYNGLSYLDAKEIAIDVFKQNFIQLKGEAATIASERATQITDQFLEKIQKENPLLLENFNDPGIQDSMFNVQKEYAKCGDKDLADLLVEMLLERISSPGRSIAQIVLDEAIKTVHKLTVEQLDAMALNFIVTKVIKRELADPEAFVIYFKNNILSFSKNATFTHFDFKHIISSGCAIMSAGNWGSIEKIMVGRYPGIFQNGLTESELKPIYAIDGSNDLIMKCFNNDLRFQFRCLTIDCLESEIDLLKMEIEKKDLIISLFNKSTMNVVEVRKYLSNISNDVDDLLTKWTNSSAKHIELTSVGTAIVHTYIRNKSAGFGDLQRWLI